MFDDIDPVRPIRRTQEQVSLDFSEYNKKLQRFEIKELLKVGPYMITLNIGKIAHVFNRYDHKLVGVLNSDILWDIKTLMYNATRKSVIVIYVKREPTRRKSIQCCELLIKDFERMHDYRAFKNIFTSEEILYPGYIGKFLLI